MKFLQGPLQRLANLMEEQNTKVEEIHSVLTVDLKKAANDNSKEFKKQTVLLTEIRDLLRQQVNGKNAKSRLKTSFENIAIGASNMLAMAIVVAAATALFSILPTLTFEQIATVLTVSGLFLILTPIFEAITKAFNRSNSRILIDKFTGNNDINSFGGKLAYVGTTGIYILSMAMTIAAASAIFQLILPVNPLKLLTALALSYVMVPISVGLGNIIRALGRSDLKFGPAGIAKVAILPFLITGIVMGYVAAAHALQFMPDVFPDLPPLGWIVGVSVIMVAFSYAFERLSKGLKRVKPGGMLKIAGAIPILAIAILLSAKILSAMPDVKKFNPIPFMWAVETTAALTVFTIPFLLLATFTSLSKLSAGELFMNVVTMMSIALAMTAVAWVTSKMPEGFGTPPPYDWTFATATALTVFAIPFFIVGKISEKLTPTGMLYGAAGMILLAGTMFVVSWIFSALPDLSAISKNFTDAFMYPVNNMITALARFKNEIGVENMVPLAGGLFAIAAGWLALTAAMAGSAAGGLFSSVANLGSTIVDGLSKLFGGEAAKTPFDLIELLTSRQKQITDLAPPFEALGRVFAKMSLHTPGVINGMAAILPFTQLRKMNRLQKSATAMDKIATAYQKISTASKAMNVNAINASARMFEAIADIAKNDGEDAMTVLAEKLMEAVEKLSGTVEQLENTTGEQSGAVKDAISGALESFKKTILGGKSESEEDGTGLIDMSEVIFAIQELEARFDRPIQVEDPAAF